MRGLFVRAQLVFAFLAASAAAFDFNVPWWETTPARTCVSKCVPPSGHAPLNVFDTNLQFGATPLTQTCQCKRHTVELLKSVRNEDVETFMTENGNPRYYITPALACDRPEDLRLCQPNGVCCNLTTTAASPLDLRIGLYPFCFGPTCKVAAAFSHPNASLDCGSRTYTYDNQKTDSDTYKSFRPDVYPLISTVRCGGPQSVPRDIYCGAKPATRQSNCVRSIPRGFSKLYTNGLSNVVHMNGPSRSCVCDDKRVLFANPPYLELGTEYVTTGMLINSTTACSRKNLWFCYSKTQECCEQRNVAILQIYCNNFECVYRAMSEDKFTCNGVQFSTDTPESGIATDSIGCTKEDALSATNAQCFLE